MSARPRFFLLPGIAVRGPRRGSALLAVDGTVLSAEEPLQDITGQAGWRLLGGNNRELGRSAHVYPLELVAQEITRLQAGVAHIGLTVSPTPRGTWYWTATLGSQKVAMSSRSYGRQRECRYNAEQFLRALPVADFHGPHVPSPQVPRSGGVRTLPA